MAPANKSKAAGVSASSFLDLKAQLSKQEAEFAKDKASGKRAVPGGVSRPNKKPTVWARSNKGVASRASRDLELEAISRPTLESARAALERKAKIYDKLKKGKTGGLNDAQYDALLVDFDSKSWESHSEDEDESLTVPQRPDDDDDDDDPIIEYEDEFGRMRTARRSEVPRELLPRPKEEVDEDEDIIIRNPVNHFPVYEPSAERVAAIEQAASEAANPLAAHYDASNEVRAKAAGFYQFSGDEETRRKQMEELKRTRDETERARKEVGAVDVKIGEASGGETKTSRAMEKRKRELEERRKLVEAKRRKLKGSEERAQSSEEHGSADAVPMPADAKALPTQITTPRPPSPPVALPSSKPEISFDPFAALEAQSAQTKRKKKGKGKGADNNDADSFLAQLAHELGGGTSK